MRPFSDTRSKSKLWTKLHHEMIIFAYIPVFKWICVNERDQRFFIMLTRYVDFLIGTENEALELRLADMSKDCYIFQNPIVR